MGWDRRLWRRGPLIVDGRNIVESAFILAVSWNCRLALSAGFEGLDDMLDAGSILPF